MAHRVAEWLFGGQNPAGAVYGIIAVGALLAAENGRHPSYVDTEGSALIAACLYWLAHAYATALGERLQGGQRLTAGGLRGALIHDWTIVRGAAVPLLVLLVCWVAGVKLGAAIATAVWCVVAGVIAFELAAGIRSRARPAELALDVGVGITMGLAILALRIVVH